MEVMIEFSVALLNAVADFLRSEPMFYLFTIVCLIGIVKVFRALMP